MLNLGGITYALLNPLYLILAPMVLGGLVYAYRRGGRSKDLIVGSVMFLKKLATQSRAKRRFIPPLRFFIELLLLLLLIAAAAGLYKKGYNNKVAIIIDNSFSMSAKLSSGSGESLLDIAKRDASTYIAQLDSGTGVDVYVTSPLARSLNNHPISPSEARRLVQDIKFYYASDNIESALSSAAGRNYRDIAVLSSKIPQQSEDTTLYRFPGSSELASSLDNIAIISAAATTLENEKGVVVITATVAAYTKNEVAATLILQGVDAINQRNSTTRNVITELNQEKITLKAGEVKNFTLKGAAATGYIITLSSDTRDSDAIVSDNKAYLSLGGGDSSGILVSALSPEQLRLDKLDTHSFKWIKPDEYLDSSQEKGAPTFTIYHNFVPNKPNFGSALYINPSANGPFFNVSSDANTTQGGIEVTSWMESHPLTTYLNLPLLNFNSLRKVEPHSSSSVIISTAMGPAVIGYEVDDQRYVATAFELLPFRGKEAPLLSVLTLNIFKWIMGADLERGFKLVPFSLAQNKIESSKIIQNENQNYVQDNTIIIPGLYSLGNESGVTSTEALNFLSESESDTISQQQYTLPQIDSSFAAIKYEEVEGFNWLIYIPLLILLLDLVYPLFKYLLKTLKTPKKSAIA